MADSRFDRELTEFYKMPWNPLNSAKPANIASERNLLAIKKIMKLLTDFENIKGKLEHKYYL